ncbi:MAG: phosphoenolpyruvate--protein phosphotransferase, partial [Planctomycetota bacterium]
YTMLLLGMGLRILSLVPSQIPHVKRVIRSVDTQSCERLARKVGSFDSERQVLNFLREEVAKVLPEMAHGRFGG